MLGARRPMQCRQEGVDERDRWMSQHRRDLYRLHYAGIPGQVHAFHESTAWLAAVLQCRLNLWQGYSRSSAVHSGLAQQRTELAEALNDGRRSGTSCSECAWRLG